MKRAAVTMVVLRSDAGAVLLPQPIGEEDPFCCFLDRFFFFFPFSSGNSGGLLAKRHS